MAARRDKNQARRNQGNNSGLPGWAWGVMGLLLGIGLILAAPRLLKSDGDGFFRPQPNPDAQPAPVAINADDVVVDDDSAPRAVRPAGNATDAAQAADYDFYTLLPGKEVALSDAELAATERAEAQRAAEQQKLAQTTAAQNVPAAATAGAALPPPVDAGSNGVTPPAPPAASAGIETPAKPAPVAVASAAPAVDNTRYLLQAGAFQASGQAEELKARIALLGLGARVESAAIRGKTVYRVRMGPYGTAGDLAEAKRKLASGGLPGMAIKVE